MATVDGELLHEIMKKIQAGVASLKDGQQAIVEQIVSMRLTQMATQTDIHNIYAMVAKTDHRLDRIESRLELRELAEASSPYQSE